MNYEDKALRAWKLFCQMLTVENPGLLYVVTDEALTQRAETAFRAVSAFDAVDSEFLSNKGF